MRQLNVYDKSVMFILCTSRHTYSLLIRNMYLYNYELHILYIINIKQQDITYLKNDLTCEKIVYSINNETSNLFQSSVITFQPKHWIPDDTFGISVLLQFWDVKFCSNSFTQACHFYFSYMYLCTIRVTYINDYDYKWITDNTVQ